MKYLTALNGGFISVIFFAIISINIKGHGLSEEITLILTVSTFLFAILAGFFIAKSMSRFNEIRNSEGRTDSLMLTLYKTSQIQGKEFSNKIKEYLDNYNIINYDIELKDASSTYKKTNPYFIKIWDELISLKNKNPVICEKIIDILKEIEENRNLTSTLSKERINKGQWIVLIILSTIIIFSLFYMKTDNTISIVITTMLSSVLIIVLLLLRDIENLRTNDGLGILEESGQELFENIGKLRYYNLKHLKTGRNKVPESVRKYRLGLHKAGEKMNIIIVDKNKEENNKNV